MTFQTKQDQIRALCMPFPIEAIKQRQQGGKTLSYYPVEVIRTRLNEVFPCDYEFRVNQVLITETTMDMSCVLTLRWVDGATTVVEEWGSSDILYNKDGKHRANDPSKTCASDALKRCLAFVGCGAELYNEAYRDGIPAMRQQQEEKEQEEHQVTCQSCQETITGVKLRFRSLSAEGVVKDSLRRFNKTLCWSCSTKAAQLGQDTA